MPPMSTYPGLLSLRGVGSDFLGEAACVDVGFTGSFTVDGGFFTVPFLLRSYVRSVLLLRS